MKRKGKAILPKGWEAQFKCICTYLASMRP
jgi:hypothetical protein